MIYLRKANERGHANHGWLDSWHTFSFSSYYDEQFMGFSALRVINEDFIAAGQGFGTHPHKDMEILTYVLNGAVEHKDSMGNMEQIPAGEFQIMSAGTGIRHSEYNPSNEEELHLYQIWIIPERTGIEPRYEQKRFDSKDGKQLVLSPDARDGALKVYQDMELWRWALPANKTHTHRIADKRVVWIQVVKGDVEVNGQKATTSDGLAIWQETELSIKASEDNEILLFDLPAAE
ncbi:pirin family protein [Providencia rettgeri]|nr:pirin family protein [Providencia rettgeri]QPE17679.1 pirin family protein [Providencia rettgeri]